MLQEILEASPEQIAPAWSLLTYTFMSPIVWIAYKMPHLPFDLLPPLSDFDHLRNLVGDSFPVRLFLSAGGVVFANCDDLRQSLDPMVNKAKTHLAIKLIRVFCQYNDCIRAGRLLTCCKSYRAVPPRFDVYHSREYSKKPLYERILIHGLDAGRRRLRCPHQYQQPAYVCIVSYTIPKFSGLICAHSYLETGSMGKFPIKPWFWIALLFVGRIFKSMSDEWFVYKTVRLPSHDAAVLSTDSLHRRASTCACNPSSPSSSSNTLCASA